MGKAVPHKEFGERVAAAREHGRLTQEAVVARFGIVRGKPLDQGHYSKWEKGLLRPRYDEYWDALAKALGVSRVWLQHGLASERPRWWHQPKALQTGAARKSTPLHRPRDKTGT